MATGAGSKAKRTVPVNAKRTPRTRKPEGMGVEQWQRALRREFGREQAFKYERTGEDGLLTEYRVTNPVSGRAYRVAIRGCAPGENFCSCPDFAVNTLGTCKHVEWLIALLERKRGGKKALKEGFHPPFSEVYVHYGPERRVRFFAGRDCPDPLQQAASEFFDTEGWLRPEAYKDFDRFHRIARDSDHEVRVYEDALELVAQRRDDDERRRRLEKYFPAKTRDERLDSLLKVKLLPYQREGAFFAAAAGRAIIADDMGLGKTIQGIAAAELLARAMGIRKVLVIAPTALKHQWKQEVERFSKRNAMVVEGGRSTRRSLYQEPSFFKIINYDIVHLDLDLIAEWQPDLVILDEAQRIKNWNTRRAKAVKQIESDYAIVLTGTPLENRLEELHSIMEFVDRHHLGPLFRFVHEHQQTDPDGRVVGYRNLNRVAESLAPVLVRRRKSEVLHDLPSRTDKHFFVDMTEEQWKHHDENQNSVAELVAKWRRRGFLTDKEQRQLMVCLQNMRMSCNSTYLLDKCTDHSTKLDECYLLLQDVLEDPDNKVVIFSQWLRTHELLIRRLDGGSIPYAYYHGSLDNTARKAQLARFNDDPACRVLLCTDSGGVGLNLQHASVVIIMDQPWNPAVLEQRIGRVYRLGQRRHVNVYHFVSQGTIEHSMLGTLAFKKSMFAGVLDGGEAEVFLGKSKMKKFMESVEKLASQDIQRMPVHAEPTAVDQTGESAPPAESATAPAGASPWESVLVKGLEFLSALGGSVGAAPRAEAIADALPRLIHADPATGAKEVRIPLPDPEAAQQLAGLLDGLAGALRDLGTKRS